MWNALPYTVFDTGTLDGFKGAVNHWLLPCVVLSSVFHGAGACGVEKAIYNFVFHTWACAAVFNNNKIIHLTLLTYCADYLAFTGNKSERCCMSTRSLYCILIVKIYLNVTLTIWRSLVDYLVVSGKRANDLLIDTCDPAYETVTYIKPWLSDGP